MAKTQLEKLVDEIKDWKRRGGEMFQQHQAAGRQLEAQVSGLIIANNAIVQYLTQADPEAEKKITALAEQESERRSNQSRQATTKALLEMKKQGTLKEFEPDEANQVDANTFLEAEYRTKNTPEVEIIIVPVGALAPDLQEMMLGAKKGDAKENAEGLSLKVLGYYRIVR